jgi:AraC family transcriptional regulator, L-rhamnose operon transcriptional activator RhaR
MEKYISHKYINKSENISIYKHIHNFEERAHTHDFIEIEYVYSGSGYQTINGTTYYVERGDLLFFNFGDVHAYKPEEEIGIIDCLINPEFLGKELISSENALDLLTLASFNEFNGKINSLLPKIKFLGKDLIELETVIDFMLEEFQNKEPGYVTSLKGYTHILLTKVFRAFKKSDSLDVYGDINKIAPNIIKYIEENYDKKINLNQLAKESFYNPTYFSKIFKECFGKTLTDYINEKRMNAAINLIKSSSFSIEDICYQVGYSDKKYFYKLFKEHTGTTPNTYRKLEKK